MVDAVVEMRRFPDEALFETMLDQGTLTEGVVTRLAAVIAQAHERAEVSQDLGGATGISGVLAINEAAFRATGLARGARIEGLCTRFRDGLTKHCDLLNARREQGKVRRCHGDLILRNICLYEGEPVLFDCLEFDEALATIDVLYDLAFLLMDFWRRGEKRLANLCFNRYFDLRDETDGLALLPFFMALRAAVRAHVAAAAGNSEEAEDYLHLAECLLAPRQPLLLVLGGFSGSGKSTVAARVAGGLGPAPGARILASDRIRKALHGVGATDRLPESAYTSAISERVYALAREGCRAVLRQGHAAVTEAVFDRSDTRSAIAKVAGEAGLAFFGFWLEAPLDVLAQRIALRRDDASDATVSVMASQVARGNEEIDWPKLDATVGAIQLAQDIRAHLANVQVSLR